ncbi:hypothetical protein BX070DRAFT_222782 [Coemansia spiralis]|nr:hypothetical protein BX070DRAFT_222782 [Coemansia spiralis]
MLLIKSDSPEIIEAACNALAYLFKYLSKSLTIDLRPTFNLISSMLGVERQRANIRRFAAESMAFLIRKLRGDVLQSFVAHVLHYMLECPPNRLVGFRDGIALLFFECMRNVNTQLHSRASGVFAALLRELYKEEFAGSRLEDNDVYLLALSVLKLTLHYVKRDTAEPIWSVLFAEYDAQTQAIYRGTTERLQPFTAILGLLSSATIIRKGSRVSEYKFLIQRCRSAFEIASSVDRNEHIQNLKDQEENKKVIQILTNERIKWLLGILLQCDTSDLVSTGKLLLDLVFANEALDTVLSMSLTLARLGWPQWNQIMLPYLTKVTISKWSTHRTGLLLFWSELFQKQLFKPQNALISSVVTARGQILFPTKTVNGKSFTAGSLPQALLEWLTEPVNWGALSEQSMTIPTSERAEFDGIEGESSDEESPSSKPKQKLVDELAIKSAVLAMLAHTAADAEMLMKGLALFVSQISGALAELTSKIAGHYECLQYMPLSTGKHDKDEINGREVSGDEFTEALGLFVPKDERLFWGAYHQLYPLVCLFGRTLKLEAEIALHAPPAIAAEKLMDAWCLVLDSVMPAHSTNTALIEGMYKVANALKSIVSSKKKDNGVSLTLQQQFAAALSSEQLVTLIPRLENNLLSVQPSLRLKTLQLLSLFEQIPAEKGRGKSGSEEECDVIQMAIDIESAAATLDAYKDKLNHMRRMAVFASSGRVPKAYENVFPYIAVAQFSVNLSLIYPEVIKQLGMIAGANTGLFWRAAWKQLQRFNDQRTLIETGLTPDAKKWLNSRHNQWSEQNVLTTQSKLDGHAMECPNLVRFDVVFNAENTRFVISKEPDCDTSFENGSSLKACVYSEQLQCLMIDEGNSDLERVDYSNIQRQLVKMFADVGTHAAESHSKQIVPTFLAFIKYEFGWTVAFFRKHEGTDLDLDVDLDSIYAIEFRDLLTERSRRAADAMCTLWLTLFSKFKHPHSLYKSPVLHSLFMRLLTRGDNSVQRRALDCMLAWRESDIMPYAGNLRNLVDEKRFREELNTFNIGINGESINVVHRKKLLPVLFRILHGQMMVRGGKASRKDGMKTRRMAILNALVDISQDELRMFVGIGLESFGEAIARSTPQERLVGDDAEQFTLAYINSTDGNKSPADESMDVDADVDADDSFNSNSTSNALDASSAMEGVPHKAQISYFHLLSAMIKQLGFKSVPIFHESLVILLSSVCLAQRQLDMANDELKELEREIMEDEVEIEGSDNGSVAGDNSDSEDEEIPDVIDDDSMDAVVPSGTEHKLSGRKEIEHRKSIARNIRYLAVKCLTEMFVMQPPMFDFTPYIPCIYEVVVDPRIDNLSTENTQNSSALLLLLKSWSLTPRYFSYLISYNQLTVRMLLDVLVAPKVQPKVVMLVLDVLQVLLDYDPADAVERYMLSLEDAEACAVLVKTTVQSHVSQILSHMRTCFIGVMQPTTNKSVQVGKNGVVVRQIHILSRISEFATRQTEDAKALIDLMLPVLKRPNGAVPERTKGDVLNIMRRFVPLILSPETSTLSEEAYHQAAIAYLDAISVCFGRIRLDSARTTLSNILFALAHVDRARGGNLDVTKPTQLETAASIIEDINSYSTNRIGEPDFDRRLAAYGRLNEELWCNAELLNSFAWTPILYNLTYFAQDKDELSIRSNASYGLIRFAYRVSQAYSTEPDAEETQRLGRGLISVVLPATKYALTSKEDVVRTEFLGVLRKVISECGKHFEQLRDLTVLESNDEEANFFYNIVHIQIHRRLRAIRRFRELISNAVSISNEESKMDIDEGDGENASGNESESEGTKADSDTGDQEAQNKTKTGSLVLSPLNFNSQQLTPISPANIRSIFMPLLEYWALADNDKINYDLANESITTIGVLGAVLPWPQYNSIVRKYLGMMKKSPKMEKRLTRLVLALLDNFHFDLRDVKVDELGRVARKLQNGQNQDAESASDSDILLNDDEDIAGNLAPDDEAENSDDFGDKANGDAAAQVLQAVESRDERILEAVVSYLLPMLKKKISELDDDSIALRAPVAMALVRILTALPKDTMNAQLPGILTTICNMLRAKAQSARNATRDTLIRIAKFLGPAYFGFLVKELSASLTRGPQKHILAYTLYTLLKEMWRQVKVGDLDYTLEPIVDIVMQDIFGKIADEKDAEEWTTKMKEAKVHHGPDCFEMLASITSFENVRSMLAPIRDILSETDTPKRTKVVDTVLRRISIGLNRNKTYNAKSVLVFCYSIINQYLAMSTKSVKDSLQSQQNAELYKRTRLAEDDEVTVYARRKDAVAKRDYLQANAHRFVQFGLDIVYYGLKRDRFDVKDTEILGMLDPFVDLTGNGLYSRFNSIITLCCKIWTIMVRLPLPSVSAGIPVVIRRLFSIFRQTSSTNSEMIQNCFKLLASLLRSKSAEKLMIDYKPIELPDKAANDDQSKDGNKKKGQQRKGHVAKNALLDENQLRDLIDFIRPDIEEPERQATAFSLIRAILTRRMIVDSLYTLLDSIRELMISAQADNMREMCRLTWFQFLMDYPLGERRLTNAMSFIVQNATSYEFESGRTSALEIMGVITNRFADELLLPNAAEPFFLGLVLIIARDESAKCRELAAHLLPELVARFDPSRMKRMWILLDQWSAGTSNSLQASKSSSVDDEKKAAEARVQRLKMRELGRAALQCYGIIIEPLGDKFTKRIPTFLSTIDMALSVSLQTWKEAEMLINAGSNGIYEDLEKAAAGLHSGDNPQEVALAYWETAYMAINAFGRFGKALPQKMFGDAGQSRIWLLVLRHLTHPHTWVRLAAARLLGIYASAADPSWMLLADAESLNQKAMDGGSQKVSDWDIPEHHGTQKYVLMSSSRLQEAVHGLVVQLGSKYLSEELGNQAVKNLYFVARCFLTSVPQSAIAVDNSADYGEQSKEKDDAMTSNFVDNEGSGEYSDSDASAEDDDEDVDEDEEESDITSNMRCRNGKQTISKEHQLNWLVNRISSLARTELIRGRGDTRKRTYCFRWFAAVISLIPPSLLAQKGYITPIVSVLFRTTEDDQAPMHAIGLSNGKMKTPAEQLADVKALANDVIRLAQDRIGVTAFTAVLSKVQGEVHSLRKQRRERRKQLAVTAPELHAKKKARKTALHKRNKRERDSEAARKKIRTVVKKARSSSSGLS